MTTDTDTTNDRYTFNVWCDHEAARDNAEDFWEYVSQFVADRETPMPWSFWDELYEAWNS